MSDPQPQQVSERAAAWGLFILFLAYTLSFVDRTILSLLIEPMKRDMGLSDTQISLLQGLAFSLVYTVAGVPIAMVADRRSRRAIVAVGVGFWSFATALCGLAGNFWQLFLARMGVGVGEASLGPCAYSLIADMFPEERRGRAMAIYGAGVKVGAGMALVIGGSVVGYAAAVGMVDTPFGPLRAWQLVFIIVGMPGLIVAALAMTIAEPVRATGAAAAGPPVMPFVRANAKAVAWHFIALGFCATTAVAVTSWVPSFYIRVHGFTAAEIGWTLGLILLITGTLGAYAGGALSDRLSRRGYADATLRAALIGIGVSTLFGPVAMIVPSAPLSLVLLTIATAFAAFCAPSGGAALQRLVPGPYRARMAALFLLVVTLLSGVLGPISVALATDYLFGDDKAIGWSLALVLLVGDVGGAVFLMLCMPHFRESLARQAAGG
ncbi:spinster family MFS transporter [Sphingomonas colocasiae]|uniref:MFS transporter n=1 Tax=Sphingomonas colocasiae TaxID=1848973 RepID=A0ABS7PXN2_9SPHN|nr:MFS transporter [Sphingomonas colocasiae]MBY8825724.1 MFS transporter [Sphingomonas colocasiae]